jgi:hypothetical protein
MFYDDNKKKKWLLFLCTPLLIKWHESSGACLFDTSDMSGDKKIKLVSANQNDEQSLAPLQQKN